MLYDFLFSYDTLTTGWCGGCATPYLQFSHLAVSPVLSNVWLGCTSLSPLLTCCSSVACVTLLPLQGVFAKDGRYSHREIKVMRRKVWLTLINH